MVSSKMEASKLNRPYTSMDGSSFTKSASRKSEVVHAIRRSPQGDGGKRPGDWLDLLIGATLTNPVSRRAGQYDDEGHLDGSGADPLGEFAARRHEFSSPPVFEWPFAAGAPNLIPRSRSPGSRGNT